MPDHKRPHASDSLSVTSLLREFLISNLIPGEISVWGAIPEVSTGEPGSLCRSSSLSDCRAAVPVPEGRTSGTAPGASTSWMAVPAPGASTGWVAFS